MQLLRVTLTLILAKNWMSMLECLLMDMAKPENAHCACFTAQAQRANSLPGSLLKPTREEPPGINSSPKEKRKKVCDGFLVLDYHSADRFPVAQGASVMMEEFEKHFDKLQSVILACEYNSKTGTDCLCGDGKLDYRCEECFSSTPSCRQCLVRSHQDLPFHHVRQ
jgi:hypothetical protein